MQLEFPWRDEATFKEALLSRARTHFDIVLTDNTSSLLSFHPGDDGQAARLRIHRMFLHACPDTMDALAIWLTRRRSARYAAKIDTFIRDHLHLVRDDSGRRIRMRTLGRYYDLKELFCEVNRIHFEDSVSARIMWGRMPAAKRRRSIRLGSYTLEDRLIRIHPLLDQAFVPRYFVRYIVFHEMLHDFLGIEETPSGRRIAHSAEFRLMERSYPDYMRSIEWHENPGNLSRLLHAIPQAA